MASRLHLRVRQFRQGAFERGIAVAVADRQPVLMAAATGARELPLRLEAADLAAVNSAANGRRELGTSARQPSVGSARGITHRAAARRTLEYQGKPMNTDSRGRRRAGPRADCTAAGPCTETRTAHPSSSSRWWTYPDMATAANSGRANWNRSAWPRPLRRKLLPRSGSLQWLKRPPGRPARRAGYSGSGPCPDRDGESAGRTRCRTGGRRVSGSFASLQVPWWPASGLPSIASWPSKRCGLPAHAQEELRNLKAHNRGELFRPRIARRLEGPRNL